VINLINSLNSN